MTGTTIRDVTIPVPGDRDLPAALAMSDEPGGRPGVVLLHEAFGLDDDMRRIARRFAAAGYAALAPDFFAGLGPSPICVARFLRSLGTGRRGRPFRQLAAAEAWLRARPEVAGRPIGVAGFCLGGGFALLHAADAEVAVVAPFYGAVPADAAAALAGICPVVASYGGRDRVFGGHAGRLTAALDHLGVEHDVKVYPEAGHAFMSRRRGLVGRLGRLSPMRAGHVEAAADDAWRRTLAFFDRHLAT